MKSLKQYIDAGIPIRYEDEDQDQYQPAYSATVKEVTRDPITRDYRVTVNGNVIGYTATRIAGWELADAHVHTLLMDDTAPALADAQEGA